MHNCLESAVAHRDSLWALPNLIATGVITRIEAINYESFARLFPNPTTNNFTLQLSTSPITETYLMLYDALGREVKRQQIVSTTTTLQRNQLPAGLYVWQLQSENKLLGRGKLVMEQ